ncbi:nitrogenase component 1 [Intestinibacter bartlettii]|mgnify:FL=1|uniref:nitrogenase component 1 n=1 Tax=Intestinibacter bartlettii TaxID=261299 RepID=UPI000664A85B|nr:nitrogenase component 1 [Intestinibacter bartlettii]MDU1254315.1 nitrogenase component 1 [Peptostreptococcaceae bacterium]MDU5919549.1 nitrogenase component 1 [Clostridiales bacterium]MCB5744988.1 nitrogenase component 1 [Intestinibacter bartlettii]MDU2694358.1 nitrogenase component 1 [Intestinibacter bartlettii]MDU4256937.1 nitrogenase component 1 [Intestinibacter bartlettii]
MKQIASRISIYSADAFGVCSALYELGGLCVMHDASGCNSTYNTHDEPRWYDFDSMVYISGLSEMEAIMGDDQKFIDDIVYTAKELSPNFIAMAGTPIPTMIGTDFKAIANIIEKETNIPTFGFDTTGMHSYVSGAYKAFEALAKRFLKRNDKESRVEKKESIDKESREAKNTIIKVNILGATPLDFSINKSVEAMVDLLKENNFEVISTWAMGSSLEYIKNAGDADVNLVVSYSGMGAAKYMYENLNIPYVIGTPFGKEFAKKVISDLKEVKSTKENKISYSNREIDKDAEITIVGESIMSESLAYAISKEKNKTVNVISSLETDEKLLLEGDKIAMFEDDIEKCLKNSKTIIADPLFRPICPLDSNFISLPHEAFSGRIYRDEIPNIINKSL